MAKNKLKLGALLVIPVILLSLYGASFSYDRISIRKTKEGSETVGEVQIGSQVWTSKNLDVVTYRNGDVIPQVQDKDVWASLTTGAWCYCDNDASNGTKYGKLYNWYAVHDDRGLAPIGYHIPTDAEWSQLTDYLGGEDLAGRKMKSAIGWGNNGNGTNLSGFSGLPGCSRNKLGVFTCINDCGNWWSSTEVDTSFAWARHLDSYVDLVPRGRYNKRLGFSVRCVKD